MKERIGKALGAAQLCHTYNLAPIGAALMEKTGSGDGSITKQFVM